MKPPKISYFRHFVHGPKLPDDMNKSNTARFSITDISIKATAVQCTVVGASTMKGEINYFVPYEGLK